MLSKIINESAIEVKPVVWRRSVAAPPRTPHPERPRTEAADEANQLRVRISELDSVRERESRKAYEAGLQAGEISARQHADEEVRATVEKLAITITEIASLRADMLSRAEADTVRLTIEIARRILHREVTVDTSALEALIKAALEKLQGQ